MLKSKHPPKAGVMGWPVDHSLSPRLHGWWLERYGLEGSYMRLLVPAEDLPLALKKLCRQGFRGVNLTVPHKEAALLYMDHIDPMARRTGAVNTVLVSPDGALEGRNTDVFGFAQNLLSTGYAPRGRPAAILGAGGAARAAIVALLDAGASEIRIINRTPARAGVLAESFGPCLSAYGWDDLPAALEEAELLVNATSLGMKGQPPLICDLTRLPGDALVTDMVYAPLETGLLRNAKLRGNRVLDGLGMLLHQARPAFEGFFGQAPEVTEELRRFVLEG
ncbi:MAG: shikimate dehydrogenase [Pseudomonadota bacterium]|nr:shikimate dehydrogenase [Pseudomonadota bacterium]